jgi:hypothetical protein
MERKMSNKPEDRTTEIIVNGRPREVVGPEVTFDQIVKLAFENPPHGAETIYTVTYRKGGNDHRPEGIMVEGDTIKVKKGTTFNVTATNRS